MLPWIIAKDQTNIPAIELLKIKKEKKNNVLAKVYQRRRRK
jgi:hypothetical protein